MTSELYTHYQHRRPALIFATAILTAVLLVITIQRNLLWRDPIAFFEQNTRLEPNSLRAWGHLSTAYIDRQNYTAAFGALQQFEGKRRGLTREIRDRYFVNLLISLAGMGRHMDAIQIGKKIHDTKIIYDQRQSAIILNSLAVSYGALGYGEQAILSLEEALQLDPSNQDVIRNYARVKKAGLR